jgi:hypothetical protein
MDTEGVQSHDIRSCITCIISVITHQINAIDGAVYYGKTSDFIKS